MKRILPAVAVTAAVTLVLQFFLADYEARLYDTRMVLFARPLAAPIVLVEIDQASLDFYSRHNEIVWPWPRGMYGRAVSFLRGAGARVVGIDLILSEPSPANYAGEDENLAAAMQTNGRVFMPVFLGGDAGKGAPPARFALPSLPARFRPPRREGALQPVPLIAGALQGGGNALFTPDHDGVYRRQGHLFLCQGRVYPSFALALARAADPGLDVARLPLAADGTLPLRFYHPSSFPRYSMAEIIQSQVRLEQGLSPALDPRLFRDKVVLIGAVAPGLLDLRANPLDGKGAGFEIHATATANFLARDFLRDLPPLLYWPWWLGWLTLFALVLRRMRSYLAQVLTLLGAFVLVTAFTSGLFALGWNMPLLPQWAALSTMGVYDLYSRYHRAGKERKFLQHAFRKHLSDSLLKQILRNPDALALGGNRTSITIFFSDLAGFTSFSERLTPEEVVSILNDYLQRMTREIIEQDGYINKFIGDAVMALWGAPAAVEQPALKAVRAALRCQRALADFNRECRERGGAELHMRIGLNSGDVIVGNIGSSERLEYTAMGDPVNLASRLEGLNKQYGTAILCGAATRAQVGEEIVFRRLDRVRVKGKQLPVEIFEVVGEAAEVEPAVREAIARFEIGLAAYFAGDFAAAAERFAALPDDPPAREFLHRCRRLQEDPPPNWDGVMVFSVK